MKKTIILLVLCICFESSRASFVVEATTTTSNVIAAETAVDLQQEEMKA